MPKNCITKRCRNCGQVLPRGAFDQQRDTRTGTSQGLKKSCRECCETWQRRQRDEAVRNAPARFWSYVDKSAGVDACWEWQGARSPSGYGRVTIRRPDGRIALRTHRYAYELTNGPIPEGFFVCHRCDNPPCCNPAHLFAAPPAVNTADGRRKGRIVAKLDAADLDAIRSQYAAGGTSYAKLAKQYAVTFGTIRDVIKGTIGAASKANVHS